MSTQSLPRSPLLQPLALLASFGEAAQDCDPDTLVSMLRQEFEEQAAMMGWDVYSAYGGVFPVTLERLSHHTVRLFGCPPVVKGTPYVACELEREGELHFVTGLAAPIPPPRLVTPSAAALAGLLGIETSDVVWALREGLAREIEAYGRAFGFGSDRWADTDVL